MTDFRDPNSMPPELRDAHKAVSRTFLVLVGNGWSPMDINAFVVGMCRTSMEDIVGKNEAIKMDREWRESIDWSPKAA